MFLFSELSEVNLFWSAFSPGVLALCGMNDEQGKHVMLCSCNDNSVRLYDLPS
jgi:hypothetical protein